MICGCRPIGASYQQAESSLGLTLHGLDLIEAKIAAALTTTRVPTTANPQERATVEPASAFEEAPESASAVLERPPVILRMDTVPSTSSIDEIELIFRQALSARVPVYLQGLDNFSGKKREAIWRLAASVSQSGQILNKRPGGIVAEVRFDEPKTEQPVFNQLTLYALSGSDGVANVLAAAATGSGLLGVYEKHAVNGSLPSPGDNGYADLLKDIAQSPYFELARNQSVSAGTALTAQTLDEFLRLLKGRAFQIKPLIQALGARLVAIQRAVQVLGSAA